MGFVGATVGAQNQSTQSDQGIDAPVTRFNATRTIRIKKSYLNFPVKNGAPMRHVSVLINGKRCKWQKCWNCP